MASLSRIEIDVANDKRRPIRIRVVEQFPLDGLTDEVAVKRGKTEPANGTDLRALADRRISITPLELDLTHEPTLTRLAIAFAG
jgi:broad specificity polyphosphatase/5'/3'-nucleotidase SurE